jgi:hypothetical protein
MLQRGFPEPLVLVLLQQELQEVLDLGELPWGSRAPVAGTP